MGVVIFLVLGDRGEPVEEEPLDGDFNTCFLVFKGLPPKTNVVASENAGDELKQEVLTFVGGVFGESLRFFMRAARDAQSSDEPVVFSGLKKAAALRRIRFGVLGGVRRVGLDLDPTTILNDSREMEGPKGQQSNVSAKCSGFCVM